MFYMKLFVILFLQNAYCWRVNDEEYDKMPALFTLDDHYRCLLYNGTYCYVKVDLFSDTPNPLMDMIHKYSYQRVRNYNHTYLEKGVCVTKTCQKFIDGEIPKDPSDLHEILNACMNDTIWNEYGLQARVTKELCQTKEDVETTKTDVYDWLIIAVAVFIVAINALGTYYDIVLDVQNRQCLSKGIRVLLCFSIIKNFNYLKKTTRSNEKVQVLKGVNALRIAAAIPVMIGHATLITLSSFLANTQDFEKGFDKLHWIPTYNGSFVVHVFFVLASFLLVYNLEMATEIKRLTWKDLPLIVIHRLCRQVSVLFLVVTFSATWMRHLGSGPLWGRNVLQVADQCRTYWWSHVLAVNNYIHENKLCNIHTWHIAVDTQLFLLAIVMYVAVQGRKRLRNLILLSLLLIGCLIPALHVMWYNLDAAFLFNEEFSRTLTDDNFKYLNVLTHTNITGYVVGMYTGYKVSEWKKKGVSFNNKNFVFLLKCVWPATACLVYGVALMYDRDTPLAVRMVYQGLMRVFVGSFASISIIGIAMKVDIYHGIMEWSGWVILGKLNFCLYLSHMNFVHMLAGLQTHLQTLNFYTFTVTNIGFFAFSYLIAIPLYLMVEAPLNPLLKVLLAPPEKPKAKGTFLIEVRDVTKAGEDKTKPMEERCEDSLKEDKDKKI